MFVSVVLSVAWLTMTGSSLYAWHLSGFVRCPAACPGGGSPINVALIEVTGNSCEGPFTGSAGPDNSGFYSLHLPDCAGSYTATIGGFLAPDAVVTGGTSRVFTLDNTNNTAAIDWEVSSATLCGARACV